ncbi:unnamed protein product [Ceratitis capitata]|uniref:(Mediterranean fruit fly) hypothetical protein n=1 Tax=Ceratitis capitata TaxID=7213 RepID=A0A811UTC0_CERCA|nr:unnamed protein product [Ceratitis capitata]
MEKISSSTDASSFRPDELVECKIDRNMSEIQRTTRPDWRHTYKRDMRSVLPQAHSTPTYTYFGTAIAGVAAISAVVAGGVCLS